MDNPHIFYRPENAGISLMLRAVREKNTDNSPRVLAVLAHVLGRRVPLPAVAALPEVGVDGPVSRPGCHDSIYL